MKIMIVDGQGGGVGRCLVEALEAKLPKARLLAVGTNAAATANMMKGGDVEGATGENAVVVNSRKADVIVGPMGIVMADAMLGEITPKMAQAIAGSSARLMGTISEKENIEQENIKQNLKRILDVINTSPQEVYVAAIDGRCASGKTTLAKALAKETGAGVIHMDDFFLPEELRTKERLSSPGGNVHYERFREEVLENLKRKRDFSYRAFDCKTMTLGEARTVAGGGLYIVEGAYSCHPKLGDYMNLRIFSNVSREVQRSRVLKRGGEAALESFTRRWIPMEEAYFEAFSIPQRADLLIDSTPLTCYHNPCYHDDSHYDKYGD